MDLSSITPSALSANVYSRRAVLRGIGAGAVIGAGASLLAGCGAAGLGSSKVPIVNTAGAHGTIQMMAWQGYEGDGFINSWSSRNNISVHNAPLSSNDEILTQLKAGGMGRYDLAAPNSSYVPLLAAAGVLQPIDISKIPNAADYLSTIEDAVKQFLFIDGQWYGLPYLWGLDGMIYNASKIPKPTSWNVVWEPQMKGKVALVGPVDPVFETWTKMLGFDRNTLTQSQLDQVVSKVTQLVKSQCNLVTDDPTQALAAMARGDVHVIASGLWLAYAQFAPKGDKVAATIPKEGGGTFVDAWVTPANAPNIDAAYAFLNEVLSPTVQAKLADALVEGATNKKAVPLVSAANRSLYPYNSSEIGSGRFPLLVHPISTDGGKYTTYEDWSNAWQQIQAAAV